jgi:hypothetical protein
VAGERVANKLRIFWKLLLFRRQFDDDGEVVAAHASFLGKDVSQKAIRKPKAIWTLHKKNKIFSLITISVAVILLGSTLNVCHIALKAFAVSDTTTSATNASLAAGKNSPNLGNPLYIEYDKIATSQKGSSSQTINFAGNGTVKGIHIKDFGTVNIASLPNAHLNSLGHGVLTASSGNGKANFTFNALGSIGADGKSRSTGSISFDKTATGSLAFLRNSIETYKDELDKSGNAIRILGTPTYAINDKPLSKRILLPALLSFRGNAMINGIIAKDAVDFLVGFVPGGYISYDGHGVLTAGQGAGNGSANFVSKALGTYGAGGKLHEKGAIFFDGNSTGYLSILNNMVGMYKLELDKGGNATITVWQWK